MATVDDVQNQEVFFQDLEVMSSSKPSSLATALNVIFKHSPVDDSTNSSVDDSINTRRWERHCLRVFKRVEEQ